MIQDIFKKINRNKDSIIEINKIISLVEKSSLYNIDKTEVIDVLEQKKDDCNREINNNKNIINNILGRSYE